MKTIRSRVLVLSPYRPVEVDPPLNKQRLANMDCRGQPTTANHNTPEKEPKLKSAPKLFGTTKTVEECTPHGLGAPLPENPPPTEEGENSMMDTIEPKTPYNDSRRQRENFQHLVVGIVFLSFTLYAVKSVGVFDSYMDFGTR
uniref:Uncharacterized protein n=2 Tax=Timema TaxID=61471 RepID=A0A7R9D1E5_TIMCR|nr:unnamed protein product [Timema cristinae]